MSRKAIERETRRKLILKAARQLFDEQGVENTSMDDIATAAEYTRRTLYAYFKSRDVISLSILIEDLLTRWDEQKKALTQADTGLEKIIKWAESLYSFTLRNSHSIRLQLYWDLRGIDRELIGDDTFTAFETINHELAESLREIFHLGISDGSLRSDLPVDMTISQFLYSFRSILNRALSSSYSFASFDADEYVKYYLDNFIRVIKNEGASQNEIE
jgi:AcrR family transcriptional regulator